MSENARREAVRTVRNDTLVVLRSLIGSGPVALLDHPSYQNVGDSMIWLGERNYLAELDVRVRYSSNIANFDPVLLRKRHPNGPILLQGGGNFGDLWPQFQNFRERIVSDFPDRRIIQLPQSVFFLEEINATRANHALAQHPDFTVLVRDHASAQRMDSQLPAVHWRYCPDMAFGLQLQPRDEFVGGEVLLLARNDHEVGEDFSDLEARLKAAGFESPVRTLDWGLRGVRRWAWRLLQLPGRLVRVWPRVLPGRDLMQVLYEYAQVAMSKLLVDYGVSLFLRARLVITNRLHAYVLASLLECNTIAIDNNYGKISGVRDLVGVQALNEPIVESVGEVVAAVVSREDR